MKTGSLGDVVFEVTDSTAKVLRELEIKLEASISTHGVHMKTGLTEFTGMAPQEITFKVCLSAYLGADPESELKTLTKYMKKGQILIFIMGDKKFGSYRWLIKNLKMSAEYFSADGNVTQYDVSVSLIEYVKG